MKVQAGAEVKYTTCLLKPVANQANFLAVSVLPNNQFQ